MTKPTDEQIKEALEWVGHQIFLAEQRLLSDYHHRNDTGTGLKKTHRLNVYYYTALKRRLRTLRTALEEYGKPKTVSREWVDDLICDIDVMLMEAQFSDVRRYVYKKLKERGIEITGPSTDDKS